MKIIDIKVRFVCPLKWLRFISSKSTNTMLKTSSQTSVTHTSDSFFVGERSDPWSILTAFWNCRAKCEIPNSILAIIWIEVYTKTYWRYRTVLWKEATYVLYRVVSCWLKSIRCDQKKELLLQICLWNHLIIPYVAEFLNDAQNERADGTGDNAYSLDFSFFLFLSWRHE